MKYLLLICGEEGVTLEPKEAASVEAGTERWVAEMDGRKIRLLGHQLEGTKSAKTVRIRRGKRTVVDGPFAETKEQIAGFDIIECADMNEAIEVASKHPVAGFGTVEIRPFWSE